MRRLIYTIAILSAMLFSGCAISDEGSKRPNSLATCIWDAVRKDLSRVNEILLFADRFYEYYTLDDDSKQAFYSMYLSRYTITAIDADSFKLVDTTNVSTTITTTINLTDSGMTLERGGGSSFSLALTRRDDGRYNADFSSLAYQESTGSAQFVVGRSYDEQNRIITYYDGSMTMVDPEESSKHPLTLKTDISDNLTYYEAGDEYGSGELYIDCYDERFDSHDKVHVGVKDFRIYLTCYGETEILNQ